MLRGKGTEELTPASYLYLSWKTLYPSGVQGGDYYYSFCFSFFLRRMKVNFDDITFSLFLGVVKKHLYLLCRRFRLANVEIIS